MEETLPMDLTATERQMIEDIREQQATTIKYGGVPRVIYLVIGESSAPEVRMAQLDLVRDIMFDE